MKCMQTCFIGCALGGKACLHASRNSVLLDIFCLIVSVSFLSHEYTLAKFFQMNLNQVIIATHELC